MGGESSAETLAHGSTSNELSTGEINSGGMGKGLAFFFEDSVVVAIRGGTGGGTLFC